MSHNAQPEQVFRESGHLARWLILVAPVPAIMLGAFVMQRSGVPRAFWMQNVLVLTAMLLTAIGVSQAKAFRSLTVHPWIGFGVAFTMLASTFFEGGLDGVHRWISFGSFRLNAGAICLPLLLIAASYLLPQNNFAIALVVCVVPLLLLVAQPDFSAVVAYGTASLVLVGLQRPPAWHAAVLLATVAALLFCVARRTDPLGRVVYVEDIVSLAAQQNRLLAASTIVGLALIPASFFFARGGVAKKVVPCLAVYFALSSGARLIGNFPVPFLGYGASAIIGYYITVAWLMGHLRPVSDWRR